MASRSRRVVWSLQARHQLGEALEYISKDSLQAALAILQDAFDVAGSLSSPEVAHPAIREIFVHRYRLMYEVRQAEIQILAFLHGARDFVRWQAAQ
jgi:plasmid stabilization system protein ParE